MLDPDPWKAIPIKRRRKYWRIVKANIEYVTLDGKDLHWPTLERLAAARGFSANLIKDPANMVDVINRLFAPPNF